jgi:hypothetical protein
MVARHACEQIMDLWYTLPMMVGIPIDGPAWALEMMLVSLLPPVYYNPLLPNVIMHCPPTPNVKALLLRFCI